VISENNIRETKINDQNDVTNKENNLIKKLPRVNSFTSTRCQSDIKLNEKLDTMNQKIKTDKELIQEHQNQIKLKKDDNEKVVPKDQLKVENTIEKIKDVKVPEKKDEIQIEKIDNITNNGTERKTKSFGLYFSHKKDNKYETDIKLKTITNLPTDYKTEIPSQTKVLTETTNDRNKTEIPSQTKILTETTNDRNRKIENELEISKTNEKESMKLVDVEIKLNSKNQKTKERHKSSKRNSFSNENKVTKDTKNNLNSQLSSIASTYFLLVQDHRNIQNLLNTSLDEDDDIWNKYFKDIFTKVIKDLTSSGENLRDIAIQTLTTLSNTKPGLIKTFDIEILRMFFEQKINHIKYPGQHRKKKGKKKYCHSLISHSQ